MDENPYGAPQEKPIDRGSELGRWRAIDWGMTAGFFIILWVSIRTGLYETHRYAVIGLLVVVGGMGFYAHWRVRRAKRRGRSYG
jgi:hypothetical protein